MLDPLSTCRRNGKPTSLGCFDAEEQAARAYDKMMLWCELHNAAGVKGGITNFDPSGESQSRPPLRRAWGLGSVGAPALLLAGPRAPPHERATPR